jgi:hemoglobin
MRMSTIAAAMLATVVTAATATGASAQMMQKTLYERLGGTTAITAVVDDFVGNVAADKRINGFFAHTDIARLKFNLVQQICQGTGGPCFYTGRDMKTAHAGMGVRSKHFNALVQDLGKTLKKFKVPAKEQGELVAILAPMKKDIVTR